MSTPAAVLCCIFLSVLSGCAGGEAGGNGSDAASGEVAIAASLSDGPVQARVSTSSKVGRYSIEGDLDADGALYRFCGTLEERPATNAFPRTRSALFLGDGAGKYRTLVGFAGSGPPPAAPGEERCERKGWLDDHPPSLAMFEHQSRPGLRYPRHGDIGAESYIQLALLALTNFEAGAGIAEQTSKGQLSVPFDFEAADDPPMSRNEDRWQMEPLIRRTGETELVLTIEDGHLASMAFQAPSLLAGEWRVPVEVAIELGAPGSGEAVPPAAVAAME